FLAKYYPSVELSKLELASEQISEHPQAQGQHVNDLVNRVANKLPFSFIPNILIETPARATRTTTDENNDHDQFLASTFSCW
ncbi:unnamed protein product, partial [Ectocarpus fasciculatus]